MKTLFRRIAGAACACVTLLGGIPFTPVLQEYVMQAEAADTIVDSVLITGVPFPYIGEHPVTTGFEVDESEQVKVVSAYWYDETANKRMSSSDVFEKSHSYFVSVYLEPKTGYVFPMNDLNSMSIWFGKRSDESYADEILHVSGSDTRIAARNSMLSRERPVETVTSLLITGMQRPYAGEHPVETGITIEESDQATVADVGWFNMTDGKWMNTSDVFENGKEYSLNVYIDPQVGYEFPMNDLKSMSIWFDKRSDESYADKILGVDKQEKQICAENEYICVEKPLETVKDILISNVPHPYAGEHPVTTGFETDEPDKITVVSAFWMDVETGKAMKATDVFTAGKEYYIGITLDTKEGYTFPMDALDSMSVYINKQSDESLAEKVIGVNQSDTKISVRNYFICTEKPAEQVKNVLIEGLTHPYSGTRPTLTGISTDEPDQVRIVSVEWFDYETGQPLSDTYNFADSEKIGVEVVLEPRAGYAFPKDLSAMDVYFGSRSDATVAEKIEAVKNSDKQIRAVYSYITYEKKNNIVEKITVGNFPKPAAGGHPTFEGITTEASDHVVIQQVDWWNFDTGEFLTSSDEFLVGREYCLRIWFSAAEGWELPEKASDVKAFFADGDEWRPAFEAVNSSTKPGIYCCRIYYLIEEPEYMLGDVDENGQVTASDAQLILTAYADMLIEEDPGLSAAQFSAADVDGDGKLTAIDAQHVLMYFLLNNVLDEPTEWSELIS